MPLGETNQHAALTRLTRLAQREPEAKAWIKDMLVENLPDIVQTAVEVAEETGPPMPEILTEVLREEASVEAADAVARHVPMETDDALQDLAIAAGRALLADATWPQDAPEEDGPRRRHALQVALAGRLATVGRREEGLAMAEDAIAVASKRMRRDPSIQPRLVDAYDIVSAARLDEGEPGPAVEAARQALDLRRSLDDPYRPAVEGEVRLGWALVLDGAAEKGVELLANAAENIRGRLESGRDPMSALREEIDTGDASTTVRISVRMGFSPSGFDEAVLDVPVGSGYLQGLQKRTLVLLVGSLQRIVTPAPALLEAVVHELVAGLALMRRVGPAPEVELPILEELVRWGTSSSYRTEVGLPALADQLSRVANEAATLGDIGASRHARELEITCLRAARPLDRNALMEALRALASLLVAGDMPDEAVTVMQEAVELAEATEIGRAGLASTMHNLARRLTAAGRLEEAMDTSSQAVALLSAEFLVEDRHPPDTMAAFLTTLVSRGVDCDKELKLDPSLVNSVLRMLDRAGIEPGSDLLRICRAAMGVTDSALRQGELETAKRLYGGISALAIRRPDDRAAQLARGLLGSNLTWHALARDDLAGARSFVEQVAAASREVPGDETLLVALGTSAADLIGAYMNAGDETSAVQVAGDASDALLSPAYLAARESDLGTDQAEFVAAIKQLAGQAGDG